MTADAISLGSRTEYLGNDHIVVGNGSQLPINDYYSHSLLIYSIAKRVVRSGH